MTSLKDTRFTFIGTVLATAFLLLTGCSGGGGGGGGGGNSVMEIDDNNADTMALAATEGTEYAYTANATNPFAVEISTNGAAEAAARVVAKLLQPQAVGAVIDFLDDCGGTIEVPDDPNATSGTMTFNSFCLYDPVLGNLVIDGTVNFSLSDPNLRMTFNNVTVTHGGQTETLNMSMTVNLNTGEVISMRTNFTASSGVSYSVENFTITGNPSTGLTVSSGRIYLGNQYLDVHTEQPLVFSSCASGYPNSGKLVIEGSNGSSAAITFDSCSSATLCVPADAALCDTITFGSP